MHCGRFQHSFSERTESIPELKLRTRPSSLNTLCSSSFTNAFGKDCAEPDESIAASNIALVQPQCCNKVRNDRSLRCNFSMESSEIYNEFVFSMVMSQSLNYSIIYFARCSPFPQIRPTSPIVFFPFSQIFNLSTFNPSIIPGAFLFFGVFLHRAFKYGFYGEVTCKS